MNVLYLPAADTKVISIGLASSGGQWYLFSNLKHLLNVQLHVHHRYVAIYKHKHRIKTFASLHVTLDHKTSHKGHFFEIEIYTSE